LIPQRSASGSTFRVCGPASPASRSSGEAFTPATERLAAVICDELERRGFTAVLTGGACVMTYAEGRYVSKDLDLVLSPSGSLTAV